MAAWLAALCLQVPKSQGQPLLQKSSQLFSWEFPQENQEWKISSSRTPLFSFYSSSR